MRSDRSPWFLLTLVALTALAAAVMVGRVAHAWAWTDGIERVARDFLEASMNGDVDAALDLVAEPVDGEQLLVPEAVSSDWSVEETRLIALPSPGSALVQATIAGPDDTPLTADLRLTGSAGGWKLEDPFGWIMVDRGLVPFIEANGYKVELSMYEDPNDLLAVLPGVYDFYSTPISLLEPAQGPVMFLGDQYIELGADAPTASGSLNPFKPRFQVRGDADDLLADPFRAFLDRCVADAGLELDWDCPFLPDVQMIPTASIFYENYVDVSWSVTEYPVPALAVTDAELDANSLLVTHREAGYMEAVAYSDGYTDSWGETVEYGGEVRYTLTCPIWITGVRAQIGPDGDFTIVADTGESLADASLARTNLEMNECSGY